MTVIATLHPRHGWERLLGDEPLPDSFEEVYWTGTPDVSGEE
jgi:hypothetical protein